MIYDTIAPCKRKKGFEGIPDEFYNVSLKELKNTIETELKSFEILRETKVMLVFKEKGTDHKLSIFPSLRAFLYGDIDEHEASNVFKKISKSLEEIVGY